MSWAIGIVYWAGAALLWLPLALALNPREEERSSDDLLAGIVLAVVWPVTAPFLALLAGARWLLHRWTGAPAASVFVRG